MQDSEDANGKKEGKSSEDTIGRDRVKRGEEVKGSGGKAKGSEKARSVEAIDGSNMVEIRAYSKLLLTWLEPHLHLRERKHTRVKRALQRAQLKELLRDRAIHPYVSSQFFYDRLSLTTKQASFVSYTRKTILRRSASTCLPQQRHSSTRSQNQNFRTSANVYRQRIRNASDYIP